MEESRNDPVLRFRGSFDPLLPGFAEEEQLRPPAMDLEAEGLQPVEPGRKWIRLPPEEALPESFRFRGFLDGVQRTVLAGVLRTREGIRVPVYRARVMAGLLVREGTTPRMGPVRAWDLLVAPFRAAGERPEDLADDLRAQGLAVRTGREVFGVVLARERLAELLAPRPALDPGGHQQPRPLGRLPFFPDLLLGPNARAGGPRPGPGAGGPSAPGPGAAAASGDPLS
jgi:hypothetical protein